MGTLVIAPMTEMAVPPTGEMHVEGPISDRDPTSWGGSQGIWRELVGFGGCWWESVAARNGGAMDDAAQGGPIATDEEEAAAAGGNGVALHGAE